MSSPLLEPGLRNLAAWSLQVGVLALAAAALSRLLPIERPKARLAFGQALLVLVVGLPLVQPWRNATLEVGWSLATTPLGAYPQAAALGALATSVLPEWPVLLAALLLLGLVVQLTRVGAGLVRLRSLRRHGRPWDPPAWLRVLRDELAPPAHFLLSDATGTPATFGLRRPVILLPSAFVSMDRECQQAIAAHELVHARRRDWLALVLEETLKAVLFFHPAVHWLVGRVRLAREQTVDAIVVHRLGGRDVYLESLVEVARMGVSTRALPAAPFLGKSHLRERVDLLLKEVVMSRVRTQVHVGASAALILLAVSWAVSAAPLHSAPAPASKPVAVSAPSTEDKAEAAPPKIVHKVNPDYPDAAQEDKSEGMFRIAVVVGKDGAVRDARVVASSSTPGKLDDAKALKGDPRLAEAAVAAVRQWRYEPVVMNGKAVEVPLTVTINFKL